ncbi:hypothetical protein [Cystobacter fuscus]|uniref:hypothetical protein n=1 Tax=Cystobacter fuscus TaxID=43 RepID=UPI0037C02D39
MGARASGCWLVGGRRPSGALGVPELELQDNRERILNGRTPANLQARLVELLPAIAEKLPQPQELRSVSIGGAAGAQEGQALTTLVTQMLVRSKVSKNSFRHLVSYESSDTFFRDSGHR